MINSQFHICSNNVSKEKNIRSNNHYNNFSNQYKNKSSLLNSQKANEIQKAINKVKTTSNIRFSLDKKSLSNTMPYQNKNNYIINNNNGNLTTKNGKIKEEKEKHISVKTHKMQHHISSSHVNNNQKYNNKRINQRINPNSRSIETIPIKSESMKISQINTFRSMDKENIIKEQESQVSKFELEEPKRESVKSRDYQFEKYKQEEIFEKEEEETNEKESNHIHNQKPEKDEDEEIFEIEENEIKSNQIKTDNKNQKIISAENIQNIQENSQIKTPKKNSSTFTKSSNLKIPIEDQIGYKYFDVSFNKNIQVPSEYINIIYYNLLLEESKGILPKANPNYMKNQKEINEQMRSILVDWIIDVHFKFEFMDETLYMTIFIIDRYLSVKEVERSKLQLLGIVALMIATKHEEIDLPKADDFIYITDNAYSREEVFQMENDVLKVLNFNLLFPSPIKFFEILAFGFKFNKTQLMMGKYLMESFLIDLKCIKYKSSVIACACAYIVMKFFKFTNYSQSYNKKYFSLDEINLGEHLIKECAKDICLFVDNIGKTNFKATINKFSTEEYEKAAILVAGK